MGLIVPMIATVLMSLLVLADLGAATQRLQAVRQQHIASYLEPATKSALDNIQAALASDEALGHAIPSTLPLPSSAPVCGSATLPDGSVCPYSTQTTAVSQGTSSGYSASPNETCYNYNGRAAVDETCQSYTVTTILTDTSGTVVGERTQQVSYRLFARAPYAVLAGLTQTGSSSDTGEGDTGGCTGVAGDTSCGTSTAAATDTRLHTYYGCVNNTTMSCDTQASQDEEKSAFASGTWANGNQSNSSGWSR